MICDFCGKETDADKVEKSAKSYICSHCVQLLLNETQENLSKAYALAVEKGYHDKARAIQSFLEENINDRKTENTERDMVRAGFNQKIRPSHNRVRT